MAEQTFSLTEVAALLGKHRNTISKWIGQGCPYVEKADRDRGKEWQLSLPAVMDWREKYAVEQAVGDTSKLDIDEARRRKTVAEAALAELELSKQRGEVVSLEVVSTVVGDQLSACKARLVAIPTKVAPVLVSVTDVTECRDIIDAAVREALNELSGYDGAGGSRPSNRRYGSDDEGDDSGEAEAAAAPDRKRVGGPGKKAKP